MKRPPAFFVRGKLSYNIRFKKNRREDVRYGEAGKREEREKAASLSTKEAETKW